LVKSYNSKCTNINGCKHNCSYGNEKVASSANIAIINESAASCPRLGSYMADQVDVIIQVSSKLIVDACDSSPGVPDELPL